MLRLSLLLLLAAAAGDCCAPNSPRAPPPTQQTQTQGPQPGARRECDQLGVILAADLVRYAQGRARQAPTAFEAPTDNALNGRFLCNGIAARNFYYADNNGQIQFASGMQCTNGQWFVVRVNTGLVGPPEIADPTPVQTPNVRCTN